MPISVWSSDLCSSDLDWIHGLAADGIELYSRRRSVPELINLRAQLTAEMIGALGAAFADDKPALGRATQTLVRLRAYETDIILAQIGLLEDRKSTRLNSRH